MSNVLIGIIGVILFIGLALAGALFLGPRFQEATVNSSAASVSTAMQQFANAANMYEVDTGIQLKAVSGNVDGSFLAPGYMKSIPRNPYSGLAVNLVDKDGAGASGNRAAIFYTDLGSDAKAKAVCRAIEKGAGAADPEESQDAAKTANWSAWTAGHKRIGCLLNTGSSNYQAYVWL